MFHLHLEEYAPGGKSQKHGHVNEAAFYILDGKGYEIHDGVRYDWQAGDVAIVHNNCVHQHFNASPDKPARARDQDEADVHVHEHAVPTAGRAAPDDAGTRGGELQGEGIGGIAMAWDESRAWRKGRNNQKLYQALLDDAAAAPARNAKRKKIVRPEDMPGRCRAGLLKHLINEGMNTRMETVDAYMLIIPPGSRSGKHRHPAEECLYVLEAAATTCTRTATSRSPTPTTGSRRPR